MSDSRISMTNYVMQNKQRLLSQVLAFEFVTEKAILAEEGRRTWQVLGHSMGKGKNSMGKGVQCAGKNMVEDEGIV